MKKRLIYIVATLALLASLVMPSVALAAQDGSSGGSFRARNQAPVVNSVEVYTDQGLTTPASSMSPLTQYFAKANISDGNKLKDLSTVVLTFKYYASGNPTGDPTSDPADAQTVAHLTLTVSQASPDWAISAGTPTSWAIIAGNCVQPTLNNTSGDFVFAFNTGRVATECLGGDSGNAGWGVYAKADDDQATHGIWNGTTKKGSNWYGEIGSLTTEILWTDMELGQDEIAGNNTISSTYYSNGDYKEQVKADATWQTEDESTATLHTADLNPGASEFVLQADDGTDPGLNVQVLSASYVDIATDESLTTETGDTTANNTLWLSLGDSGIENDVYYEGLIYFQIENR